MNKSIFKKWWLWLIIVVVIFGLIGGLSDDEEDNTDIKNQAIATATYTPKPTEQATAQPTEAPLQDEEILSPELIMPILESSFDGIAEVSYEESTETFTILPTDDDFVTALIMLSSGEQSTTEEWENLVKQMCDMSKSMSGYCVSMANPTNTENTLLMVYEGIVLYDFTK